MNLYPKEEARVKDYSESVLYNLLYKEHKLIDGFGIVNEMARFAEFIQNNNSPKNIMKLGV